MSNNTLSRAELSDVGEIKNIHYGDVLIKFGDVIDANNTYIPYVGSKVVLKKNPDYLQTGDVVIADTAEDDTVGKATEILNTNNIPVISGLHTIPCRPNYPFAPSYLGYYLNSKSFHEQLYPFMQGIKVTSISKTNIGKTQISYPNSIEQSKIAKLLNLISERVEKQRRLVEALKSYKRGVLSLIFSNKMTNCILSDIFKKGKAGGTPQSSNSTYYNGDIPFLSIADMTEQGKYIQKTEKHISVEGLHNSTAWLVPCDSLILSMYASYGLVAINKVPITTSQAMFAMTFQENISVEYVYYYLSYLATTDYYTRMVSTGTQPNLNAEKVKVIPLFVPLLSEQGIIVRLLQTYDNKIAKEEQLLAQLQTQKIALLQNLFI